MMVSLNDAVVIKAMKIFVLATPCITAIIETQSTSFKMENLSAFQQFHLMEAQKGSEAPVTIQIGMIVVMFAATFLQILRGKLLFVDCAFA